MIANASYPTGSLDFLAKLQSEGKEDIAPAAIKLDIIITGAGLGGLSAAIALCRRGHRVKLFEQAPELEKVGAGIQLPSNSTKLLARWGVDKFWGGHITRPENIFLRRWQNGELIGQTRLGGFQDDFGSPYFVIHRAHLHVALYNTAVELGAEIILNSRVDKYDANSGSITLHSGSTHTADLVIAADGIKSIARATVLGEKDMPPFATGFAAYRATVDCDLMKQHEETRSLLQQSNLNLWIGDQRHVMSYIIDGGTSYNMVLSHPMHADSSFSTQEQILEEMRNNFKGWDPRLEKLISLIKHTLKWPLLSGEKLPRWVHPSNKLIIMGDAAHAMLPYMSEGAAMAVEDGAALAEALNHAQQKTALGDILGKWERVRNKRSSQMQEASRLNGKLWHFADGPEQTARDEAMRCEVEGTHYVSSPNQWSDPTTQRWCYGYDAEIVMRDYMLNSGKVN